MKAGTATLWAGVALLGIGLFFGAAAIDVPGVALIALSLGLRTWVKRTASRVRIATVPGPAATIEGEPYAVGIAIEGASRLAPGGWIEHPRLPGSRLDLAMPLPETAELRLRLERRGRHRLGAPTLVVADPLGQREERIEGEDRQHVLVLPRVEAIQRPDRQGGDDGIADLGDLESLLEGSSSARSAGIDVDVDGLRPHRPGSPSSRIHWPTVARTGELYERLLVASAEGGPLVVLDASRPISAEALDSAVRAAASLCVALARAGGCSLRLSGHARPLTIDPGLRAWPAAHAALALVEEAARAPVIRTQRLDAAFWVTAAAATPALVPALASATYVVSPSAPAGEKSVFAVAGCVGWRTRRAAARPREAAA